MTSSAQRNRCVSVMVASIKATEKADRDEVANGPAGDRVWEDRTSRGITG
jgi:hypothetical protein